MKKSLIFFCALFLVLSALPVTARADIIYAPWDDAFSEDHREQCDYHNRSYTAAGPNGDVTAYESPVSARKRATFENGSTLWISYVYTDESGIGWGFVEDWERDVRGWVPMDYLVLIYDGVSFEADYGHLFVEESGAIGAQYAGKTIYFWKYPGSSDYVDVTLSSGADDYRPEYSVVFEDSNGNKWGRCGYYMALKGYWLNLTDPTADDAAPVVPAAEETEAPVVPEVTVEEIVPNPGGNNVRLVVIGAVAATVAVTILLLILLKRKK